MGKHTPMMKLHVSPNYQPDSGDDLRAELGRLRDVNAELLAALDFCERFLTGRFDNSAELMVVRAAIAKAKA